MTIPPLREYVNEKLKQHYKYLQKKYSIHQQTKDHCLAKDPGERKSKLHYRKNDFNIPNHDALARLYLQQEHMADFKSVDDTSCDPSALLNIIGLASCFTKEDAEKANKVRKEVRNKWAHCNMKDYLDEKYMEEAFKHLENLIGKERQREDT